MLYATHLDIDLGAIRHNLQAVRELAGDRKVLAAVKADAYGHGAVPLSQLMQREDLAQWLGVATVPEAIELRQAGVDLPMLKLSHAFPDELDAAVGSRLDLTVVDAESIRALAEAGVRQHTTAYAHLAIDTGMRRIGCRPEQAAELLTLADRLDGIEVRGVFTHLPVADAPEGQEFTSQQLAGFAETVAALQAQRAAAGRAPLEFVHSSNSGALLNAAQHPELLTGMTMVRPGIMVYGLYPDASSPHPVQLRQALAMRSKVSFVKQVAAGESVGYGRTWAAPQPTWIATIPVGYADGFSRLNSNRGRVLIGGHSYPVVGRVCMDQTMVDLGPQDPGVHPGDPVTLIGTDGDVQISTDELAELMGTISYEVSCLIPSRVERRYLDSAAPNPLVTA